jgi:deazaflavin-dependent oxidoreductase (nitroreductase family)
VNPIEKGVMRAWCAVYRASNGRLLGKVPGSRGRQPILLITTTGRKSGKRRTNPIGYIEDDGAYAVVASAGGQEKNPAWFFNLRSNPDVEIRVQARTLRARADVAGADEKARLWPRLTDVYPKYDDYQTKTSRQIPVVVLRPQSS